MQHGFDVAEYRARRKLSPDHPVTAPVIRRVGRRWQSTLASAAGGPRARHRCGGRGIANFATGVVGTASLAVPSFVLPTAISAWIFCGVAGVRHMADRGRTKNQNIAMVSDLFVSEVLAVYVADAVIR
jgi:hypothetical protein